MQVAPSGGQICNQFNSSWEIYSSYGLNTLGPLCLWQCLVLLLSSKKPRTRNFSKPWVHNPWFWFDGPCVLCCLLKIARGGLEEAQSDSAVASESQDQLQTGKGGLKKKNMSRRNLRQKLKSNLKSPSRGVLPEEPASQASTGMQFLCPICNKTFASLTQLNKHQKFHMQK